MLVEVVFGVWPPRKRRRKTISNLASNNPRPNGFVVSTSCRLKIMNVLIPPLGLLFLQPALTSNSLGFPALLG